MPIVSVIGQNNPVGPKRSVGPSSFYVVKFEGDPTIEGVDVPPGSLIVAHLEDGSNRQYIKTDTEPTDVRLIGDGDSYPTNTFTVNAIPGAAQFTTIQQAIDAAVLLDLGMTTPAVILVSPGTYNEELQVSTEDIVNIIIKAKVPVVVSEHVMDDSTCIMTEGLHYFYNPGYGSIEFDGFHFGRLANQSENNNNPMIIVDGDSTISMFKNCTFRYGNLVGGQYGCVFAVDGCILNFDNFSFIGGPIEFPSTIEYCSKFIFSNDIKYLQLKDGFVISGEVPLDLEHTSGGSPYMEMIRVRVASVNNAPILFGAGILNTTQCHFESEDAIELRFSDTDLNTAWISAGDSFLTSENGTSGVNFNIGDRALSSVYVTIENASFLSLTNSTFAGAIVGGNFFGDTNLDIYGTAVDGYYELINDYVSFAGGKEFSELIASGSLIGSWWDNEYGIDISATSLIAINGESTICSSGSAGGSAEGSFGPGSRGMPVGNSGLGGEAMIGVAGSDGLEAPDTSEYIMSGWVGDNFDMPAQFGGNGGSGSVSPPTVGGEGGGDSGSSIRVSPLNYSLKGVRFPHITAMGGGGGGSGGGDGDGGVTAGGAGGAGGGYVILRAPIINLSDVVIDVSGGAGGSGSSPNGDVGGGGGGGAGGNGGIIIFICETLNIGDSVQLMFNGGSGGTGGIGGNLGGSAGGNGEPGLTGMLYHYRPSTNTWSNLD